MKAFAHGRVNLIGEHTDYNGGFVLPTVIPQKTTVELTPRADAGVFVESEGLGTFHYRLGEEKRLGHWCDYIQGLTWILAAEGHRLTGFDLKLQSQVPIGSGLSSSAALLTALLRALRAEFHLDISDIASAQLCQKVENEFVGARVGIMDPMACAMAQPHHVLFIDTRSLQTRSIPMPAAAALIVIHSGVAHRNVGGGYNERRAQCEQAASILGVDCLRDTTFSHLQARRSSMPEIVFRRARHVITENERVLKCVATIEAGDLATTGLLLDESHQSMRDDFEVSIPEIDLLVQTLRRQPGVYGARLTGGGFGGSIVGLVDSTQAHQAAMTAAAEYQHASAQLPTVIMPLAER